MFFFKRHETITPHEAHDGHKQGHLVLIDVRQPGELRGGKVRGAKNIPLGELKSRLSELDPAKKHAFLCASGARSSRATGIAAKAGLDAANISGGIMAWSRAGLPIH